MSDIIAYIGQNITVKSGGNFTVYDNNFDAMGSDSDINLNVGQTFIAENFHGYNDFISVILYVKVNYKNSDIWLIYQSDKTLWFNEENFDPVFSVEQIKDLPSSNLGGWNSTVLSDAGLAGNAAQSVATGATGAVNAAGSTVTSLSGVIKNFSESLNKFSEGGSMFGIIIGGFVLLLLLWNFKVITKIFSFKSIKSKPVRFGNPNFNKNSYKKW